MGAGWDREVSGLTKGHNSLFTAGWSSTSYKYKITEKTSLYFYLSFSEDFLSFPNINGDMSWNRVIYTWHNHMTYKYLLHDQSITLTWSINLKHVIGRTFNS